MQNNINTRVREWPTNISIGQSPSKFHLLYEHLNPVDTWDKPAGFWEASVRRARRGPHLLVRPLCIPLLLKWRSDIWIIAFYCHKVQIRTLASPGERSHIVRAVDNQSSFGFSITSPAMSPLRMCLLRDILSRLQKENSHLTRLWCTKHAPHLRVKQWASLTEVEEMRLPANSAVSLWTVLRSPFKKPFWFPCAGLFSSSQHLPPAAFFL